MKIEAIKIIKSDERWIIYDCDKLKCIFRKKWTTSANHIHDKYEILYLVSGEIELTIWDEIQIIKTSKKIKIPANIYHKIFALTDIIILEDKD